MSTTKKTSRSATSALQAFKSGYSPIPIPKKTKIPDLDNWLDIRFSTPREISSTFNGGNVGLLLGEPSGGLIDVDLDAPEAGELADLFLPHTDLVHGRTSSPRSHRWYMVDPIPKTKKFADPTDRASLVEIRSTGGQTIVPPSLHPSGERLRWASDPWAEPADLPRATLVSAVAHLSACTLVARHWPTGSRHDAALALAGGLLRAGWDEPQTVRFVCAAAQVGGDEEAAQRRRDVETTAQRLKEGGETQGWPTLVEILGERVVKRIRDWLQLEDETEETLRNKRSVGQALRDGVPEPAYAIPGVVYSGHVHWLQGEPEDGKTLIALRWALDVVKRKGNVMIVDEESGLAMTADRLGMMGAKPEELDTYLHYYERPGLTMDEDDIGSLLREARSLRPQLVIFDSAADLLQQGGLSEDKAWEVTAWVKTMIEPLAKDYGAGVVVIDHVPKPGKDSVDRYARGSGAKKSKADAAWRTTKIADFGVDPPRIGLVELRRDKDRPGRLPAKITFRVGVTNAHKTIVERQDTVVGEIKPPEQDLKDRIIGWLQDVARSRAKAVSTREVQDAVPGKNATIQNALGELAGDYGSPVDFYSEEGEKRWWAHTDPIIEVDFN